jgi:prevent-host-death family protein
LILKEEHMADMAVSTTQDEFATILNRVADGQERIVLHRDGEPVAAVIPVEDLKLLERLIDEEEDRIDLARAERVLSDPHQEWIPWEQVKAEEGL